MTKESKGSATGTPIAGPDDDWLATATATDDANAPTPTGPLRRLREWLLLDDIDGDPKRWKLSTYRIIIASSLILCLLLAAHSFATAWALGVTAVIVTITAYYIALLTALRIGKRSPSLGAALLLLMVYACGLLILFGVEEQSLSDLGVIFLYIAPVIAWIYFGRTRAFLLMAANIAPFLYMVSPQRPLSPLGIDLLMPDSHLYLHALLFLFFNFSIPLALFRVVSALNAGIGRNQQIARRLRQSSMLYQDMFEHASGPTLICDRNGRVLRANRQACALLDDNRERIEAGARLADLFAPATPELRLDAVLQLAIANGFSEGECRMRHAATAGCEVLLTIKSLSHRCLLVSMRDISALRAMERDLIAATEARDRLIAYDALTNLPNRESLQQRLEALMADPALLKPGTMLAVACLRLNSIRSINEKFGHQRGDDLIREFGEQLALRQRTNLQAFRLRGVVFSVVVTGCSTPEQVETLLQRLVDEMPSHYQPSERPDGQAIDLELSVGVAFTRGKEISAGDLIHRGERALEIARKQAKGPLVLFNEDSAREIHREIDIGIALSRAIARNEFSLVYQPKVDAERNILGLEALIRWHSLELGNVQPSEFIPVAEHLGRIHLISDFVIDTVCRQLAAWYAGFGRVWPVAVNLSGIDLQRDDLALSIQRTLQRHRVEPAWLQLEITETGLIENDNAARRNLEKLIAIGLRIAIDDFGTGYSSLKKLSEYPIHAIKIDRSFVVAIGKNTRSDRIIQLVLTLAKVLNCEVVAEGVETRRQLQFLLDNGCRRFQGYLFHKPLAGADIDQLIARSGQAPLPVSD